MRHKRFSGFWVVPLALFCGLQVLSCDPRPARASWEKPAQPPAAGPLTALLSPPLHDGMILTASGRQIFSKTPDSFWRRILHEPSGPVRKLLYLKEDPRAFFVLTEKSISRCGLGARPCKEIYRAAGIRGKNILSFAIDPEDRNHWFLGTEKGLFESDDSGKTWFGFGNLKKAVSLLRFWKGRFFLAAGDTLYESLDLAHFDSLFSLRSGQNPEAESETEENNPENSEEGFARETSFYHDLLLPEGQPHPFWLASRDGVFESIDDGKNWRLLPESGLRTSEARFLAWSQNTGKLFAGTAKGIYVYLPEKKRWQELYQGLETEDIQGLAILKGSNETLLTLSSAGFFSSLILPDQVRMPQVDSPAPDRKQLFQELLRLEPSAQEIQRIAARYANVRNGKIRRWHTGSRLASLFPSLSFGKDFSRGNSIDIDRRGTNEADFYIAGPDDISRGWDFDVNWDLGDFIFSSAQTSIDSREKIMVELRNDILAEVTRVFYERRRLEMEILFQPAASEQDHLEKLLRLDELTSLLDGLTNGYFSKKLEDIYATRPDLKNIWNYKSQDARHLSQEAGNGS